MLLVLWISRGQVNVPFVEARAKAVSELSVAPEQNRVELLLPIVFVTRIGVAKVKVKVECIGVATEENLVDVREKLTNKQCEQVSSRRVDFL